MVKKYGQTDLSKDQAERRAKLKKLFSGPLFPKGTGGILPKYDEGLKRKQANVEVDMPKVKTKATSTNVGSSLHGGSKKKNTAIAENSKKPKSFSEAFKMAKGQKTFTFKGKSYARVTKDELEKKGFKSLRAYLNSMKGTKVAKK
jgi:hypothetical protein